MCKFLRTRVALVSLICFVVSTAFRLALLAAALPAMTRPGFLEEDGHQYRDLALNLLRYHVFSIAAGDPSKLDAVRTPGYPALVAAVFSVTGPNIPAVAAVQCVIGGLTCGCLYLLARRYMSPIVAAIAALAFGLEPYAAAASLTLMTETVSELLLLLACWSLLAAIEQRSSPLGLLSGAIMGAACLTRPSFVPIAALFSVFLFVSAIRRGPSPSRAHGAGVLVALYCIACAAPVAAWSYRNHVVFGHFQLTSLNGLHVAVSAVPIVCRLEGAPFGFPALFATLNSVMGGRDYWFDGMYSPGQFEVSRELGVWGANVIRQHPLLFLELSLKSALDVLFAPNPGYYDCLSAEGGARRLWIPSELLWCSALCLALVSVAQLRRDSELTRRTVALALLTTAVVLATLGPGMIGQPRNRLQFEPLVYFLAGIGLDALLRHRAARSSPQHANPETA